MKKSKAKKAARSIKQLSRSVVKAVKSAQTEIKPVVLEYVKVSRRRKGWRIVTKFLGSDFGELARKAAGIKEPVSDIADLKAANSVALKANEWLAEQEGNGRKKEPDAHPIFCAANDGSISLFIAAVSLGMIIGGFVAQAFFR